MPGIGGWFGDVRLALRSIRHSPLFSGVVIATLALAIGGVTAVFTLVDPMLFRPLPYGTPDQIVKARVDGGTLRFLQYADYFHAKDAGVFERAGTFYGPAEIGRLSEDDDTIIGYAVTDGFLDVLHVSPALGRLFYSDEYRLTQPRGPGATAGAQLAIITDGLWKRGFGGRPDVVGQRLRLMASGATHTMEVVGVLGWTSCFPITTTRHPRLSCLARSTRLVPATRARTRTCSAGKCAVRMTTGFFEYTEDPVYGTVTEKEKRPFSKRILIIDDDPDVTTTFKVGIENSNYYADDNKTIEVYTYNDPLTALSEFESNFYDLLLIDINLPNMNGFQLCEKILHLDINVRVCFMSTWRNKS